MKSGIESRRGVALLITLAFIALITVLMVAFSASMRIDRPAASSHLEKTRASIYAQNGVDRALATLNQFTSGSGNYWISQPGQLIASGTPSMALDIVVPLSSGTTGVSSMAGYPSPNINVTTWRDPVDHLITNRADASGASVVAMRPDWIYVTRDGAASQILQYDGSATPAQYRWVANPDYRPDPRTNPIVGRYAYWTDDESSKINYNLAWGRETTPANHNPPGHPTKIDLRALTGFSAPMADAVHGFITDTSQGINFEALNHGFFNTPGDARRVELTSPSVAAALKDNKFEVTHYNSDPDTTFFNEPRIVLTTLASRAGGRPFLDIGITDPEKLGNSANMNVAKYKATVRMLVAYLKRSDWPMVSGTGSSFQSKYYGGYEPSQQTIRLTQLAINIIDYVRSKESPSKVVVPSRGLIRAADAATGDFTLSTDTSNTNVDGLANPANAQSVFIGMSRTPRINEMGMWFKKVGTASYDPYLKVELFLPRNYGITSIDLVDELYGMYFAYYSQVGLGPPYDPSGSLTKTFRFHDPASEPYIALSKNVLNAGDYVVVTWRQFPEGSTTHANMNISPYGRLFGLRVALFQYANATTTTNYTKVEMVPLLGNYANTAYFTGDPEGTSTDEEMISSLEVDDPRINTYGGEKGIGGDWIQNTKNTFGSPNSRWSVGNAASTVVPQPAPGEPQLDTDIHGNISEESLYMPPPAGTTFTRADGTMDDNTLGMVTSVGELGYICTGMESTAKRGIPWRTFRLQASAQDATVVPDWALMDLFTVPSSVSPAAAQIATPYGNAYGGRVNLNSKVEPFNMDRTVPLVAVLLGAAKNHSATLSAEEAAELADNIYHRTLSPTNAQISAFGKQFGYQAGYDSPGEMIEVKGIGDQGEGGEALVRDIANLVTARGNIFSVYSIGQSVKHTLEGKLIITGEQRLQSMLERYLDDPDDNPATANSKVRFRPVYFRNLTP